MASQLMRAPTFGSWHGGAHADGTSVAVSSKQAVPSCLTVSMDKLALPLTESDLNSEMGAEFGVAEALEPLQVRLRRMIVDTSSQTSSPTRAYRSLLGPSGGSRHDLTFSVRSTTADDEGLEGAWHACGPHALVSARAQSPEFDGVFASSEHASPRCERGDGGSQGTSEASGSHGLLPHALVAGLRRLGPHAFEDAVGAAGRATVDAAAAATVCAPCDVRVTCRVKTRCSSPVLRFSASGEKSCDVLDDGSAGSASHVADLLDFNAFFQLPELPAGARLLDTASSFDALSIPSRAVESGCAGDCDPEAPATQVHASIADMVRAARPPGRPALGRRFRRPAALAAKVAELESTAPLDSEQAAAIWSWLEH